MFKISKNSGTENFNGKILKADFVETSSRSYFTNKYFKLISEYNSPVISLAKKSTLPETNSISQMRDIKLKINLSDLRYYPGVTSKRLRC